MGRGKGKVTLKQIQNEKVRRSAFIQRNKGLTKKVSEFAENFGVEACLIVYDGDGDPDDKPMTWPQDSTTLQFMLTKYEQQKNETTPKKFDVKDYFANKKNTVEAEIKQVRKKITMNKYPTWGRCFSNLSREQLKGFVDIVDLKIQACNQRIDVLKNTQQQGDQTSFMQNIVKMQNVTPENVVSLQSNQPDDPSPLMNIDDMIDFTDLGEWDDLMPQNNVFSSHSSELDIAHNIPQMQPIPAPLKSLDNTSLPQVSSTTQLGYEFMNLDDLMVDKSDQEWTTQLDDLDYWAADKQDDDGDDFVNWVRQPDEFQWQDNSFLSVIEQKCAAAALDVFSQPRFGF